MLFILGAVVEIVSDGGGREVRRTWGNWGATALLEQGGGTHIVECGPRISEAASFKGYFVPSLG